MYTHRGFLPIKRGVWGNHNYRKGPKNHQKEKGVKKDGFHRGKRKKTRATNI